nr:YkgJ family cysteine cluster protein [Pirellula staleyi]
MTLELPWYHEGLQFKCTQCGDCCTGAPGFVWVNQEEIDAIAKLVGAESVAAFEAKYVRKVGARRSLVELKGGDCIFWSRETRGCTVYAARPRQCRTWPFWDSNLESPEEWARTCEQCPGSGKGPLHSLEEIEKQRKVMRV